MRKSIKIEISPGAFVLVVILIVVLAVFALAYAVDGGLITEEQLVALAIPLAGVTIGLVVALPLRALILALRRRKLD